MNTPPHVVVGDEVYYRHPERGVLSGPVASAGKDGVRVKQGDEHHGVTWEHLLGHKVRKVRRMKIVERGEDGFLAEDEHGQREYVSGEAPDEEDQEEPVKEAPEEKPVKVESMTKAVDQAVLDAALIKAGFTPSLDYIRATYGEHWSLREDPAVDALWTALADGRARTDEALQGLRADLQKAHVNAYTRSDGTFVQAHEDSRPAARDKSRKIKTIPEAAQQEMNIAEDGAKPSDPVAQDHAALQPGERLWLRYGEPPASGKSRHVQHGYEEDGVSVMVPLDDLGGSTWSRQMVFSMTAGEMGTRELYVVAGKQKEHNPYVFGGDGFGSDGEPLITDARLIRTATAKERYQLVRDMERVAVEKFGWDPIPEIYAKLKSEPPKDDVA